MTKNKNTEGVSKFKSEEIKQLEGEIARLEMAIKELVVNIDTVEDEKLEIINQLKRALADYHNLESSIQKRLSLLYFQSRKSLAEKLIPVIDDMSMAVKSKEEIIFNTESVSWADGVVELLGNLEKGLEEIGLKKYIPEIGSVFNPEMHEALTVVPGEKSNTIYEVIQPGYILDDTVIRASRVIVIK